MGYRLCSVASDLQSQFAIRGASKASATCALIGLRLVKARLFDTVQVAAAILDVW